MNELMNKSKYNHKKKKDYKYMKGVTATDSLFPTPCVGNYSELVTERMERIDEK